jgi:hypothetical protein
MTMLFWACWAAEVCAFAALWQSVIWIVQKLKLPHLTFTIVHHVACSVATLCILAHRYDDVMDVLSFRPMHDVYASQPKSWQLALLPPVLITSDMAAYFIVDMLNRAKHTQFTRTDWVHHALALSLGVLGVSMDSPNTVLFPLTIIQELSSVFYGLICLGFKRSTFIRVCFLSTFVLTRLYIGFYVGVTKVLQQLSCKDNVQHVHEHVHEHVQAMSKPWCQPWASLLTATTWLQLGINIYFFILIIRKATSGKKQT